MALTATLATGLDATSAGDPNSLTTKSPYAAQEAKGGSTPFKPSSAWTSQGSKALFPVGSNQGAGHEPIKLHFVPGNGSAVTYTVTVWMYSRAANTWAKPKSNAGVTSSCTGETIEYISNPGYDAIWIQLSSISAGTISIYYDPANANAA